MRHRKERCNLQMGSQFPDRWQHGSKSDRKCPRPSSATSIGLRWRNSNRPDRAHLPQLSGARRRNGHSNRDLSRTRSDGVRQLPSLCSGLAVHVRWLTSLRSSQFSRPAFSAAHLLDTASGQFLRPAASPFVLSRFLPNNTGPSHRAPARLGRRPLAFGCHRKMGQKKETLSCPTSMLSGIASAWFLASDLAIRACCACPWPLPERRPATPQAARLGRSGGSGLRTTYCLRKFETTVSLLLTTRGRSVCSTWMPVGRENSYAG